MPIRFSCPDGHPLVVPDHRAGKAGRCPVCQQPVKIPRAESPAAAPDTAAAVLALDDDLPEPPAPGEIAEVVVVAAVEDDLPDPIAPGEAAAPVASRAAVEPAPAATTPRAAVAPSRPDKAADAATAPVSGRSMGTYVSPSRFVSRAYFLAAVATVITLLMVAPCIGYLTQWAPWAWVVMIVGLVQVGYITWMTRLPDWSTVWIGAWAFLPSAGLHALAFFVALSTSRDRWPLGLSEVGGSVELWAAATALLLGALAFSCWRVARPWRLDYEQFRRG
ncbi:MAG: hypothetical protein K1X74_06510 [Pirellulales bacterium]|nr:hypothetical protein [Pirellulales bacterium]